MRSCIASLTLVGLVAFALRGTAAAHGMPAGWSEVDVGGSGRGTTTVSDGTWTISGVGSDIWTPHDRFHYTYTQISGDASMTVRVASLSNTNGWAKAGIMFRQNVNADDGSKGGHRAFVMACATVGNGAGMEWRDTAGETAQTGWSGSAGSNIPTWLRLERTGNTFRTYYSSDGVTWKPQRGSSHTTVLTDPCYVGFAVCSHVEHVLATATFDHVTLPDGIGSGATTGGPRRAKKARRATGARSTTPANGNAFSAPVAPKPAAATRKEIPAAVITSYDATLRARIAEEIEAGRKPSFYYASMHQRSRVRSIDEYGALALLVGPIECVTPWERLSIAERGSLALGVLGDDNRADNCLVAFDRLARGDEREAEKHLCSAGALAAEVRSIFGE